eukprot:scaffold810_cov355-Pavlova_lutheri.AAC.10
MRHCGASSRASGGLRIHGACLASLFRSHGRFPRVGWRRFRSLHRAPSIVPFPIRKVSSFVALTSWRFPRCSRMRLGTACSTCLRLESPWASRRVCGSRSGGSSSRRRRWHPPRGSSIPPRRTSIRFHGRWRRAWPWRLVLGFASEGSIGTRVFLLKRVSFLSRPGSNPDGSRSVSGANREDGDRGVGCEGGRFPFPFQGDPSRFERAVSKPRGIGKEPPSEQGHGGSGGGIVPEGGRDGRGPPPRPGKEPVGSLCSSWTPVVHPGPGRDASPVAPTPVRKIFHRIGPRVRPTHRPAPFLSPLRFGFLRDGVDGS